MRDPDRIPDVLDVLSDAWECAPDMRLGQLVTNIASKRGVELFYLEDEELLLDLAEMAYRMGPKVHDFPDQTGRFPCCGQFPFEVSSDDRMAVHPGEGVTCGLGPVPDDSA